MPFKMAIISFFAFIFIINVAQSFEISRNSLHLPSSYTETPTFDGTEIPVTEQQSCPELEHWNDCYAHCQHNCSNWGRPMPCPTICIPGCVCDDGYVRGPDNKCIQPMSCKNLSELFEEKDNTVKAPPAGSCPSKEHWDWCNAGCQKTCSNRGEPGSCHRICQSGCVCNVGYVRSPEGKCVLPRMCPVQEDIVYEDEDFCPPNEEFSPCLAHCQRNCSNWSDPTEPCRKICVPGCICKPGMVRGPHGNCIRPRKCPDRSNLGNSFVEPECPVEEHYDQCTAHCQKDCTNNNKSIPCPQLCVPGCVCDGDLVRSNSGRCISPSKCSEQNTISFSEIQQQVYYLPYCPDVNSCTEWCQFHSYSYGYCTGFLSSQCICVP